MPLLKARLDDGLTKSFVFKFLSEFEATMGTNAEADWSAFMVRDEMESGWTDDDENEEADEDDEDEDEKDEDDDDEDDEEEQDEEVDVGVIELDLIVSLFTDLLNLVWYILAGSGMRRSKPALLSRFEYLSHTLNIRWLLRMFGYSKLIKHRLHWVSI